MSCNFLQKMNADEQRIQRLYGKLPSRAQLLNKKLQDRKYFDSGDYALSQAARNNNSGSTNATSSSIPTPLPNNTTNSTTSNNNNNNYTTSNPVYFVGSRHPDPGSIPHNYSLRRRDSAVTSSPPRRSSIITAGEV